MHRWFIPHRDTHKKAHLISWEAILVYILIFVLLQTSIQIFSLAKPGVLGTSSSITAQRVIELTNLEREKLGLASVSENSLLDQAARAKAANMFEENYWAHFAPSGKSPWDFILSSGYKFIYAGENLAKNFGSSDDVVVAWMNSPSHKENIVNSKYKEIGIAVEDGIINGQQTTLVVQMFGTTNTEALAKVPTVTTQLIKTVSQSPSPSPVNVASEVKVVPVEDYQKVPPRIAYATAPSIQLAKEPLFNPFQASKIYSISVISLIIILLFVDFLVLKRRGVFRISSHHFGHMAILSIAAVTIITSSSGQVDQGMQFRAPDEEFKILNLKF